LKRLKKIGSLKKSRKVSLTLIEYRDGNQKTRRPSHQPCALFAKNGPKSTKTQQKPGLFPIFTGFLEFGWGEIRF